MGVFRLVRVGSPYNAVELDEIDVEQSADVMYLAHLDHAPTKLIRFAHDSWQFQPIGFGPTIEPPTGLNGVATNPNQDADNDGAAYFPQVASYVVTAVDSESDQESRASAATSVVNDLTLKRNYNTLTWTGSAARYRVFKAENTGDYGYIGSTVTTSFRDDNISPDQSDGPPQGDNPFADPGDYPSTVAFFEQRLLFGRTRNNPNAIWGSKSADFENFDISRPLKDDDALAFRLMSGRVNAVNQIVSITDLLALTSDSVFRVSGGGNGDPLGPRSIYPRRQVGRGSSRLNPLVVDNVVFYQPSVGSSVRSINYSFEVDGFQTNDLSIFSPHFFEGHRVTWWAYAQEPGSVIWAGRDDGQVLCFTWVQEQQVWGWTLCDFGGFAVSGAVISEPGIEGRIEDRLYLIMRRTIGGQERHYVERMASALWEDVADCCYLDCAVSYQVEEPQATFGGLDHLEGETVSALADGSVVSGLIVSDGKVTLPNPVSKATIGLPYTSEVDTLPVFFQGRDGALIGRRSSVGTVTLRVVNTRGVLAGVDEYNLFELKPRLAEAYGAPPALHTGDLQIDTAAGRSADDVVVVIRAPYPLPMTLTAVVPDAIPTGG